MTLADRIYWLSQDYEKLQSEARTKLLRFFGSREAVQTIIDFWIDWMVEFESEGWHEAFCHKYKLTEEEWHAITSKEETWVEAKLKAEEPDYDVDPDGIIYAY